jgi:hypothetical protein
MGFARAMQETQSRAPAGTLRNNDQNQPLSDDFSLFDPLTGLQIAQ